MTKIFVAGATGYIGKNVVKSALEQNFKVVIATRKASADFDLKDQNLKVVEISKSDNSWIENLQGPRERQHPRHDVNMSYPRIERARH